MMMAMARNPKPIPPGFQNGNPELKHGASHLYDVKNLRNHSSFPSASFLYLVKRMLQDVIWFGFHVLRLLPIRCNEPFVALAYLQ